MQPLILTYNLGTKQFQMELLCVNFGIKIRDIKTHEQLFVIESILENKPLIKDVNKNNFPDEMLIFCYFTDELLEQFLQQMRNINIGKTTLKAILTPTNCKWSSTELYNELKKEYKKLNK